MTSSNSYSSLYPFPFDLNQDDPHQHHHLFTFKSQPPPPPSSSSSSSLTCPIPFNPAHVQDQQAVHNQRELQQFHDQLQEKINVPQDGPLKSTADCDLELSIWKNEERLEAETHQTNENDTSPKSMPSKMRILRKMMTSDHNDLSNHSKPKSEDHRKQQQPPSPDTSNNTIRVCSDCNTTKTPLWRSGPRGPKSLCNACGIRQRKARRAMAAAAAAAANGTAVAAETPPGIKSTEGLLQHKAKRSSNNCAPRFKKNKKCKHNSQSRKKKNLRLEELRIILSKNSAFNQVFPQDEKEAAILLMALSYGMVHG